MIASLDNGDADDDPEDFSIYGYPFSKDISEGFQLYPPMFLENEMIFNSTDGISDAQECAARCQEENAHAGAWNPKWRLCFCYLSQVGLCKEPCVVEEGVEFSRTSLSDLGYCQKSICDQEWYYTEDYCDETMDFEEATCDAKISALHPSIELSIYGYPYTMDSSEGFQMYPPDKLNQNWFAGVTSVQQCAGRCQEEDAHSGSWNPRYNLCYCNFSLEGICKEPCLVEDGVDFSRTPLSDLEFCENSSCDAHWYYDEEYCDQVMLFDRDSCNAKIASSKGIVINECSDTLSLFHDMKSAEPFVSAPKCQCSGNLSSAYIMECKTENHCFEHPESRGRVCVDITLKYFLEIDQATGLLLDSGFVKHSSCTTYLTGGDDPGTTRESTQCKVSNHQCERILMDHRFQRRRAITICSNQDNCPMVFKNLGYDDAFAAEHCPMTFLDGKKCLAGADQICGIGSPGVFDHDSPSDSPLYGATADCSNVVPCATPECRPLGELDLDRPMAVRNTPHNANIHCIIPVTSGGEGTFIVGWEGGWTVCASLASLLFVGLI
ncbi:hypothetical protein ACHAXS_005629 [Conticribra weissflogii]